MGSVHSALSYIGDIMFFEFRGYKDLTDPDPVLLPFFLDRGEVVIHGFRGDLKWPQNYSSRLNRENIYL